MLSLSDGWVARGWVGLRKDYKQDDGFWYYVVVVGLGVWLGGAAAGELNPQKDVYTHNASQRVLESAPLAFAKL